MINQFIKKAYIVSGLPHILLANDKSPYWNSLYESYGKIRDEIKNVDADLILYFSTQWLSVIGYLFQAEENPEWLHVDQNWYEYGSIPYKFKIDSGFSKLYSEEVKKLGHNVKLMNYHGFPIDTGTIVAQKLINPDNKFKASIVSCNMYAEKDESIELGKAAFDAIVKSGKKVIVVLVSNLSNRFEIKEIEPKNDKISSAKDHEWNLKILELLGEGRLEDVSQCMRDFAKQANADMGGKGFWWLSGLLGQTNDFIGHVFDYQPVWGTGAALVGLTPNVSNIYNKFENNEKEFKQEINHQINENIETSENKIFSKKAPEPVGAYVHARRVGNLLFLSGVGPRKLGSKTIPGVELDNNNNIISYDIEAQTHSVIENVKTIIEESGSSFDKIIDVQVFLTNMKDDFKKFNEIYRQYFKDFLPCRTTVEVNALPTPIAVEFKVIAEI
jgi:2-aminomuconate deaminase